MGVFFVLVAAKFEILSQRKVNIETLGHGGPLLVRASRELLIQKCQFFQHD